MFRRTAWVALLAAFSTAQQQHSSPAQTQAPAHPGPYSQASPHWPHLRTAMFSFRTIYVQNPAQQKQEWEWVADHMDHVVVELGDGRKSRVIDAEEKKRNTNLKSYVYGLNLTVFQQGIGEGLGVGYYEDMQSWFKKHSEFTLENAFLHDNRLCPAPQPLTPACRLDITRWKSRRWVINPANAGAIAYQSDRLARFVEPNWNGIFLDEHDSGGMIELNVCGEKNHTREYHGITDSCPVYFSGVSKMLAAERAALHGKLLMLNIAEYASPFDFAMAIEGGAVQLELVNNPVREVEHRWEFIDRLAARGVLVVYSPPGLDDFPPGYSRGNWASPSDRWQLAELANYYMVVPERPDNVAFNNQHGPSAYSAYWTKAQEVDIGKPLSTRRVYLSGTDRAGQAYRIYVREFERAYVVVSPMTLWSDKEFGDKSAVTIDVPGGRPLTPLLPDAARAAPLSRLSLRHAEAAILLKP